MQLIQQNDAYVILLEKTSKENPALSFNIIPQVTYRVFFSFSINPKLFPLFCPYERRNASLTKKAYCRVG